MFKKFLIILFSLLIPFLSGGGRVKASEAKPQVPVQEMVISSQPLDQRAQILHDYLSKYNSPLADHAPEIVEAADQYRVDWRLLTAIAGVESTFGKNTPGGYNGWGWGVYGDQAIYFSSWKDGIFTVTKGLSDNYTSKGISDPYEINKTYAASPFWGEHVSYFLTDLNKFAQSYPKTTTFKVGLDYYMASEKISPTPESSILSNKSLASSLISPILNP